MGRVERRYGGRVEEEQKMELHELTNHDFKMHARYRKVCSIRHFFNIRFVNRNALKKNRKLRYDATIRIELIHFQNYNACHLIM